ncbi:FCD domain-containing protein [Shimia sagamensis]|uniref:Transcriptional regulator, GntR family n=1 Tax=Shimia sagamensis TaxID=1566352 RepID=A0ABY1NAP1_9RHOB|nr:FCD domain-containing protein [Shimia sagamensis]SMP04539.1 transcriptional regulator, GntR family [Shimia sagamensis]
MNQTPNSQVLAAKRRVSDTVADVILSRIMSGEYHEGEFLPSEKEMMTEFDVGRVSVREAIASLRWRGFLKVKQGERPRTSMPDPQVVIQQISHVAHSILGSPKGVEQFNQARLIFEQGVVQFVVTHASDSEIDIISGVHAENAALLGQPNTFVEGDVAFHRALVNVTKNPILISSHTALVEWLILDRVQKSKKNPMESHKEHEAIIAAIQARDIRGALQAVSDHLQKTVSS